MPPIGDIIWTATDSLLTFDWSVSAASDCPDIQYNILASNCGSCPTTTNHTNVTCTNVPTKDTCTFAIWRVVCGNVTEKTNNTVCIMLPLQERIDDIINFNKNDTLTVSEVTTLTGMLINYIHYAIKVGYYQPHYYAAAAALLKIIML